MGHGHSHNHNHKQQASKRIREFMEELEQNVPSFRSNQTRRKKNANYGSSNSRHYLGDAVDIKINKDVYNFLTSSKGIALMHKYSLGMLHEVPNSKYDGDPDKHWLEGNIKRKINGKEKKGTGGTGEHYHIGPDIFVRNGGSPLSKNGRHRKNIESANLSQVGRVYSPSRGAENQRLKQPLYDNYKLNQGNNQSFNNNTTMNGEGLYKQYRNAYLHKYDPNKNNLKSANEAYEDVMKKAKNDEERRALQKYFMDKNYIDNKGGGALNEYRSKKFDEDFKKNNADLTKINKILTGDVGIIEGFKTYISYDKDGEVKSVTISQKNVLELEKLGIKINGLNKIENSKVSEIGKSKETEKVNGSNPEETRYIFKGNGLKELRSQINKKAYDVTGKDIDYFKDGAYVTENGSYSFHPKSYESKSRDTALIYYNEIPDYNNGDSDHSSESSDGGYGVSTNQFEYTPVDGYIDYNKFMTIWEGVDPTLKIENYTPPTKEEYAEIAKAFGIKNKEMAKRYILDEIKKQDKINKDEVEQNFFRSEEGIEQMRKQSDEVFQYDKNEYSKLEGVDKLLQGGLMGLIGIKTGQDLAKTPLQMRDEMIGESYMDYISEMKKLSEIGLRPEEEAYAKRMLSESYQAGLDNIVRSSGGNRNAVLGNLGRLDYQKQVGLMNLAMEDAKAKREAMNKYGEAAKYISEFESTKRIANNERLYQESLLKRQTGSSLAQEGFKSLISAINEHRDNAPGSANHMRKTFLMRKMFDHDPSNPADVKRYQERIAKLQETKVNAEKMMSHYNSLPYEKKVELNKFMKKNGILNVYDNRLLQWYNDNTGYNSGEEKKQNIEDMLFGKGNGINVNDYSIDKKLSYGYGGENSQVSEGNDYDQNNNNQEGQNNSSSTFSLLNYQDEKKEGYNPFNAKTEIKMPESLKSTDYLFPNSADKRATKEGFELNKGNSSLSLLSDIEENSQKSKKLISEVEEFLLGQDKRVNDIVNKNEIIKKTLMY